MRFGRLGGDLLAMTREQNRHAEAMADKTLWKVSYAPSDGVDGGLMIPIPNDVIEKLGWSTGEKINIAVNGDKLILTKMHPSPDNAASKTPRDSEGLSDGPIDDA
jgi:bifunctional DNA-binding transcriptional regulator/antitoxin component of YhaV-PrlF toxin-antitoxin module